MDRTVTAIIIARNSERTIKECVNALGFCDQVIVGENNSEDQTAIIAKAAGATVKSIIWQGYGKTKNNLIDEIKEGWILSIDSDEIVSQELAGEIQQLILSDKPKDGYWLSRRNYFLAHEIKGCGWSPDWQLRLFRAGKGRFEEKEVHEALKLQGTTGYLKKKLNHYSYPDLKDYFDRLNRYTTLAARDRMKKGKAFSLIRLIFDPGWTFFKMYILKKGFNDGFAGLLLCLMSSANTLVKHAKHWELSKNK